MQNVSTVDIWSDGQRRVGRHARATGRREASEYLDDCDVCSRHY